MLNSQSSLAPGYEEIAIPIDADSGVAGQITPGSIVDIDATYSGAARGSRRRLRSSCRT